MPQNDDAPPPVSPDVLPPVEPPSAGFIVQLFVVPLVIVLVIVTVYLMFNWLAQMGDDPRQHVKGIARDDAASWQEANNLAESLRRDSKLRQDAVLAQDVADLLERKLAGPPANENDSLLRVFLCKVLGEFAVPEAMPQLVAAAGASHSPDEGQVRQAAVEAMALLIDNLRQGHPGMDAEAAVQQALPALLAAAADEDPLIQTSAAYALGVAGGEEASRKLEALLVSADPAVRSNAAFGLARHGNPKAIPALEELLANPDELSGDLPPEQESLRDLRRATILLNALRATGQLAAANSSADLTPLTEAVQHLAADDGGAELGITARSVDEPTRRRLGVPAGRGALVVGVAKGSPAEKAGIPIDAVIVAAIKKLPIVLQYKAGTLDDMRREIVAAGGQPVEDAADLADLVPDVYIAFYFQGAQVIKLVRLSAPVPPDVRVQAQELLLVLSKRHAAAEAALR